MVSKRAQQRRIEKQVARRCAGRPDDMAEVAAATAAVLKTRACARYQHLAAAPERAEVSVVSWNILSDRFATQDSLPWADPVHLAWEARAPALRMELAAMAADIICLQEVDAQRWDEICSWLPGYNALIQDGKKQRKAEMMLALFWRPHLRMTWAEHRSRSMLAEFELPEEAAATATAATATPTRRLLVANVHLEGHPNRPHDRVSQMKSSLQRLTARQESLTAGAAEGEAHEVSLLVAGDFNSGASETVYRLLAQGQLVSGTAEDHLPHIPVTNADITHAFQLVDVYEKAGAPLPYTRKAPGGAATIDFIFASSSLHATHVYNPLKGPAGRELHRAVKSPHVGLLCELCPSDHLPLGVVLRPRSVSVSTDSQSVSSSVSSDGVSDDTGSVLAGRVSDDDVASVSVVPAQSDEQEGLNGQGEELNGQEDQLVEPVSADIAAAMSCNAVVAQQGSFQEFHEAVYVRALDAPSAMAVALSREGAAETQLAGLCPDPACVFTTPEAAAGHLDVTTHATGLACAAPAGTHGADCVTGVDEGVMSGGLGVTAGRMEASVAGTGFGSCKEVVRDQEASCSVAALGLDRAGVG